MSRNKTASTAQNKSKMVEKTRKMTDEMDCFHKRSGQSAGLLELQPSSESPTAIDQDLNLSKSQVRREVAF